MIGCRYMRVIVFFDLPTLTAKNRREYRKFRKMLINEGFLMMQESVYCKLTLNYQSAENVVERVRKGKTSDGTIQCMVITEKQYSKIEYIIGFKKSKQIDSIKRIIEI